MAQPTDELYTVEEYAGLLEEAGYRSELVRGRLVREPQPAYRHARIQARLARLLGNHVEEHGAGVVLTSVGVLLADEPPTVRGPDLAFLPRGELETTSRHGFLTTPPALAVEILSPGNTAAGMQEKVLSYLAGGSRVVWVVDPMNRVVTVYRSAREIRVLADDDVLEATDILPGFRLPLPELFG